MDAHNHQPLMRPHALGGSWSHACHSSTLAIRSGHQPKPIEILRLACLSQTVSAKKQRKSNKWEREHGSTL